MIHRKHQRRELTVIRNGGNNGKNNGKIPINGRINQEFKREL